LLSACHSPPAYEHKEDTQPPATSSSQKSSNSTGSREQSSTATSNASGTVEFKSGEGQKAFHLTHGEKGGNVVAPDGNYLLTFTEKSHKGKKMVAVQGTDGKFVAYVSMPATDHLKLEDQSHKELYKLKMDDEHSKLKDNSGNTIYKLKNEDYGIKIEDGDTKNVLYKVKSKEGKISLRSQDDKTVLYSDASIPPLVMACFGMDKLSKDQQYALAYTLLFLRN
jgi:hypothetical protein